MFQTILVKNRLTQLKFKNFLSGKPGHTAIIGRGIYGIVVCKAPLTGKEGKPAPVKQGHQQIKLDLTGIKKGRLNSRPLSFPLRQQKRTHFSSFNHASFYSG